MRIQVEVHVDDIGATPRSLYCDEHRAGIIDRIALGPLLRQLLS
jgi:hypothetical protein